MKKIKITQGISTINNGSDQSYTHVSNCIEMPKDQLVAELALRLKVGITHFMFKKKDGTMRWAFGTLDPKLLEVCKPEWDKNKVQHFGEYLQRYVEPIHTVAGVLDVYLREMQDLEEEKPKKKPTPENMFIYWDMEAMAFRMFDKDSLIFVM